MNWIAFGWDAYEFPLLSQMLCRGNVGTSLSMGTFSFHCEFTNLAIP